MKVESGKILIRNFRKKDIPRKVEIINNPVNNAFLHYNIPINIKDTIEWFNNKSKSNRLDCAIEYNGETCGLIGLLNIDKKNKEAEYYICIDHNYSGKGIGTIASKLLIDYTFSKLNINKIYLYTESGNIPAQSLFKKIGFIYEGTLVNNIQKNNVFIDRKKYGIYNHGRK